jgi:hypothetical protein
VVRQDEPVNWDEGTRDDIDVALNEADVLGIRLEESGDWCELLLHVLALPEVGPLDPNARRIVRLTAPGQVQVMLRRDLFGDGYGPVIPLADMDAVEEFFASLSWAGSMYGWKFLDDSSLTSDWPEHPSLTVNVRPGTAARSLFWFNECGRDEGAMKVAYLIEGTITFDNLEVMRADSSPVPLPEFTSNGRRYWEALHGHDERLSVEAQRAARAGTPSWRSYTRNAVTIAANENPGP